MDDARPTSAQGGHNDPDTTLDTQVHGELQSPGAAHASHDVAGVAGAQAEGRATSELAADVRRWIRGDMDEPHDALDALVARVTDLEAQANRVPKLEAAVIDWRERCAAAEAQVAALTELNESLKRIGSRAAREAEDYAAQVTALTQERDGLAEVANEMRKRGDRHLEGKEAAEAQALEAEKARVVAASNAEGFKRLYEEAEAQVAALTQRNEELKEQLNTVARERNNYSAEAQTADRLYLESLNRAKAAEAALAEARQALAEIANPGIQMINFNEAVAVARRALADTEGEPDQKSG